MLRLKNLFLSIACVFAFADCGSGSSLGFETVPVTIQSFLGSTILFAEVADTEEKREQGLSDRLQLSSDYGMLFVFDTEERQSISVADVFLSLDVIFISEDQQIVAIEENTTALSTQVISPNVESLYVLEVNSGFASDNGISIGDTVLF